MKENLRLKKIAEMVQKGMIVADIGTDHAFLPVMLVRNGISNKVFACDIAEGPLHAAKETIAEAGLTSQITTILCDGLNDVPEDVNCIVIAGMGFVTASGILERGMPRLENMKQIIVEVNRDTVSMRQWISEHHFTIIDEIYVNDRNHDYVTICFNTSFHESYSEEECILGPVLLLKRETDYMEYLKRRMQKIEHILSVSGNENELLKKELFILRNYH